MTTTTRKQGRRERRLTQREIDLLFLLVVIAAVNLVIKGLQVAEALS